MATIRTLIAGASISLVLATSAFAGQPVTLKAEITTDGRVTLGDLFEDAGRAANVVVAPAPPAGGSVMIDAATVQKAALANGLSWSNERGLRRVIVRAGAPVLPAEAQVATTRAGATAPATKGVEVLTWTRSINAGDLISAEDLAWTVLAAAPAGSPNDAEALIGKVAKKPLRSGAAAVLRDVGTPLVIKKDDVVTVAFEQGGVALSMQAKAMGPAAVGEPVAVMNLQSKKVIQAIAAGPARAVVGPEAEALRTQQTLALR